MKLFTNIYLFIRAMLTLVGAFPTLLRRSRPFQVITVVIIILAIAIGYYFWF